MELGQWGKKMIKTAKIETPNKIPQNLPQTLDFRSRAFELCP